MENNKLSQLTQKLYEEGLSKGREEGDRLIADATEKAKKIVAEAEQTAKRIARQAETDAQELRKNTMTEIALAGREATARIKEEIASMVVARALADGVHKAALDPSFIREILVAVARNWKGGGGEKITLEALLPAANRNELDAAFAASAAALLKEGIEVGYSPDVRSGFKVGEKGGGYYIGFSDENFEALLGRYLREKVTTILYGAK